MVAINNEIEQETDRDAICLVCYRPLPTPIIMPYDFNDFSDLGYKMRKYCGWCGSCNLGFEVIQFLRTTDDGRRTAENKSGKLNAGQRWAIWKYTIYAYKIIDDVTEEGKSIRLGGEIILNELPEPAPVVTGPGGDYNQFIEVKQAELLNTMRKTLLSMSEAIKTLLRLKKG